LGIFGTKTYFCTRCGVTWEESNGLFGNQSRCRYCKRLYNALGKRGRDIVAPKEDDSPKD
jgi:DNA-directed RNA polymerase subunit RPC12/RpoP